MCGIAGLVSMGREQPEHVVVQMLDAIRHRGPDDSGFWTDAQCGVFLGHRRLSVIDVSSAGHQPMESGSGRYVIVLNGEIYNFEALRSSLAGCGGAPTWRGHSDTEVLLACIDAWGLEAAVSRAQGMFAFAAWDQRDQTLTLARDRMGEKPLYFGWIGRDFVFASEMKALATHPAWAPQVELDCLSQFLRLGYYGGARSLVSGLYRLPPGALLTLPLADLATPKGWDALSPKVTRYWSLGEIAVEGQRNRWLGRPGEAADHVPPPQAPHLAGVGFQHRVAERHLPVAGDGDPVALADGDDGGAVDGIGGRMHQALRCRRAPAREWGRGA